MNKYSTAKISLLTAITIAVADMIGIGVFTSLGYQLFSLQSGFSILLLWTLGGLVALCGALCYAELATMFQRSGGEYNFLSKAYHPAVGFMSGWLSATVGFAAPIAAAAMAFGLYFKGTIPEIDIFSNYVKSQTGGTITNAGPLALGLILVWMVTFLQLRGVKDSSRFQNIATIIKIALIIALVIFGFSVTSPQAVSFLPSEQSWNEIFVIPLKDKNFADAVFMPFAVSLIYVMYSYSGWNASTYIIEEIDKPAKTLPIAMVAATIIVTIMYVALNLAFLYATPIKDMVGQQEVALVAGQSIFGETGARIVAALICFGLVATVSAMVWIGSRVTMVMGQDTFILKPFAHTNQYGIPTVAVIVQAIIVSVLICTQSFETIVKYIGFSIALSSFVTVLGVIVLRYTQPDTPRPYKTWGYPITPIIFMAVTLFMMTYMLRDPENRYIALAGLLTVFSGLIVYYINIFVQNTKQQIEPVREAS